MVNISITINEVEIIQTDPEVQAVKERLTRVAEDEQSMNADFFSTCRNNY